MLEWKRLIAGVSTILVLGAGSAVAQYTGPGSVKPAASVAEILKNPVDDMAVVLRGKLLKKTGSDKYLFSDGTGEIVVEIEHRDFPAQPVGDATTVEIEAKVDKDFMRKPELEATRVRVVAQ
jgi:uncharacterized protein (TIGR00156 family)